MNKKLNLYNARNNRLIIESELKYSKEERRAFLESIKEFSKFQKEIFRETGIVNEKTGRQMPFSQRLKEINERIRTIVEGAEAFTLKETEDGWFDNVTISRDLKELKNDYKLFEKTCQEMTQLQQRLEGVYENIGNRLGRYYEV